MNTRTTTGLVTIGWSVIFSLFTAFAAYASTSPNCSDVLAGNTTAVSQKMMVLLGEDITKSNRITTVIPAQNNPFVTEELVSVSNDVSPNGRLPQKTLEEIRKVRSDLEKAAQEVSRLQGTFEVAFVSLIDGYCQFSNHELTQHAKIDFDHLEGLTLYSIPALLAMVDQSYAMAENRLANEQNQLSNIEKEKQRQKQQASAAAAARYQDGNVLVKVENFDGSNVMFSVTNVGSQGSLQPNFNTFSAYRTESGELVYKSESLLHLADTAGNTLQTMGIAELSSKGWKQLVDLSRRNSKIRHQYCFRSRATRSIKLRVSGQSAQYRARFHAVVFRLYRGSNGQCELTARENMTNKPMFVEHIKDRRATPVFQL
ncbi:hypothetical protein FORC4_3310 [Vibrio parahaemolyticus]|nr:hypothetical protein FORC4_3310 [Vibrio parahaemolyticus]